MLSNYFHHDEMGLYTDAQCRDAATYRAVSATVPYYIHCSGITLFIQNIQYWTRLLVSFRLIIKFKLTIMRLNMIWSEQ